MRNEMIIVQFKVVLSQSVEKKFEFLNNSVTRQNLEIGNLIYGRLNGRIVAKDEIKGEQKVMKMIKMINFNKMKKEP